MDHRRLTDLDRPGDDVEAPGDHMVDVGKPGTLGQGLPADGGDGASDSPVEPVDGVPVRRRYRDPQVLAQDNGVGAHLGGFGPLLIGDGYRSRRDHRSL